VCVWSSCTGGRQGLEGRGDHREKESAALGGSGGALGPGGGGIEGGRRGKGGVYVLNLTSVDLL